MRLLKIFAAVTAIAAVGYDINSRPGQAHHTVPPFANVTVSHGGIDYAINAQLVSTYAQDKAIAEVQPWYRNQTLTNALANGVKNELPYSDGSGGEAMYSVGPNFATNMGMEETNIAISAWSMNLSPAGVFSYEIESFPTPRGTPDYATYFAGYYLATCVSNCGHGNL